MAKFKKDEALDYHSRGRAGKIEVIPTKPYRSQRDLSLAYSPGVADPCLEIEKDVNLAYKYTAKGNLVAVISNGTAVLGLGDIGPEAAKPVMEGKALLFKVFSDIDVFDIEVDANEVDEFVRTVKAIAPTFGGINLEDIKAPEAFEIEERLKKELNIPVMHDDQHGTAIISAAALVNALELANKKIGDVKVVVNGAGAAAMVCAKLYISLGVKKENILMLDSKGVLNKSRDDLDKYKAFFVSDTSNNTLEEVIHDADVFLGLSKGGILSAEMVKSMAPNPIVFALANPDPEIDYDTAIKARKDIIMATGRSDHPNQVNNVLGFPYIFRGALDVRATAINEEMKLAAVEALANLAQQPVPEEVNMVYDKRNMTYGREYIIPKPFDPRLITCVAPAVAKAAIKSGVAQHKISDWDAYELELTKRLGLDDKLISTIISRAKRNKKRVVFAEADTYKILKAAELVLEDGIATPILLGNKKKIEGLLKENNLELPGVEIIDPRSDEEDKRRVRFAEALHIKRKRKGLTMFECSELMRQRNYFGPMMVESGEADAMISGITRNYPDTIKPALQVIGTREDVSSVAGMYIIISKKGRFFFADTTVNVDPDCNRLVEIALLTANAVKEFNVKPRIAMLSYSNFGSARGKGPKKVSDAVKILQKEYPGLIVDGEMQANVALNKELLVDKFSFSELGNQPANTLIFPDVASGNIAYKLIQEMGDAEAIGPFLLGLKKSVHILQLGSTVREIVNMVALAAVDAHIKNN